MSTKTALAILISMVALAIGLGLMQGYGAPPKTDVNAAQFTAPFLGGPAGITFTCPAGSNYLSTDLTVTLETEGRPVLLSFTSLVSLPPGSAITLQPFIDNRSPDGGRPDYIQESNPGERRTTTLHATRLFQLPPGTHTFYITATCEVGTIFLGPRWLTVWELGSGRP